MEKEIALLRSIHETPTMNTSNSRREACGSGYLVVNKLGKSRLLTENAWANVKEEVISFRTD